MQAFAKRGYRRTHKEQPSASEFMVSLENAGMGTSGSMIKWRGPNQLGIGFKRHRS